MKLPTYNFQSTVLNHLPLHEEFLSLYRKKECMLVFKEKFVSNFSSLNVKEFS